MADIKSQVAKPIVTPIRPVPKFAEPTFGGEIRPSIIPDDVKQLVMVTGHRGKGKTTFALGTDNPANICMLDYESKGEGIAGPLGIGAYFAIRDECAEAYGFNFRPIAIFERTRQIIEAIPPGRFTTLVLDNAGVLQDGCLAEVQKSPVSYGIDPQRALTGQYGGAWPGVKYIINSFLSLAKSKGIKLVVATFQPTKAWVGGAPALNKFKMTDISVWHEMSVGTFVLVDGIAKHFPAPRALVMKEQLGSSTWDETKQETVTRKRVPLALPKATMKELYRYLREPADLLNPLEGESVTSDELAPWTPTFGKEQLVEMEKLAAAAKALGMSGEGGEG